MNLHAFSTRRGCRLGRAPYVLSVVLATLLFYLSANWNVAFAQIAPPPPAASTETVTTPEDTTVTITTDVVVPAGNWYYVVVTNSPAHGTAIGEFPTTGPNYTIRYTPGSNQTSQVSFAYQICTRPLFIVFGQPQVCGTQATVTVNITPVNDPPLALVDLVSTFKNVAKDIDVLANDAGGPLLPNGTKAEPNDTVTLVSVVTPPGMGTATIVGNKIRYTPAVDQCNYNTSFTYTVRDSAGLLATGTVEVTVECGNAIITVGDPYPSPTNDHTFFVDLFLESQGMDVAAVDFFVVYADSNVDANPACLVDPNGATPALLADNVTNMPLAVNGFFSQVTDVSTWNSNFDADAEVDALRFSIAGIGNPNNTPPVPPTILTGPSINLATRRLATIKFKVNPAGCDLNALTAQLTLAELRNGNGDERGFTGPDGQNVDGTAQGKPLSLANVNQAPTDILLSNNVVREGISNAFIGFLSAVDPDVGDTATYDIQSVTNLANLNDTTVYFWVRPNSNELAVRPFLAGTPPPSGQYAVVIQSSDSFGALSYPKILTIFVTNVNRPPTANDDGLNALSPNPVDENIIVRGRTEIPLATVLDNDTDLDDALCANCTIQSVTNGKKGFVTTDGLNIIYTPTDPAYVAQNNSKTDVFTYTITDNDPSGALSSSARVTVTLRPERVNGVGIVMGGDCNIDGVIGAGDLVATAREIFDDPAGKNWYDIPLGNYAFSAYGCNSNLDAVIDVADLSCTAQKIFNNAYVCPLPGLAAAGSMVNAALVVDSGLRAAPGTKVQVPVRLATGGNAVAAAAFAVNFDAANLSFDATDSDGDGLPDAVSLNAPGNTFTMANYNAEASRVEIVIAGLSEPMPLLADGAIATVTLTVKEEASVSESAVTLTESSLSDAQSLAVPVEVSGGSIQIGQAAYRLLLPVITKQ